MFYTKALKKNKMSRQYYLTDNRLFYVVNVHLEKQMARRDVLVFLKT